ncbi:MAG: type II secretion system protein [Candidatus Omnitrophota bacterium]
MKRLFKNNAMTFLEMAVSMVIFSIIVASIFTAIYTGRLYWRVGSSQLDVQQQARQALSFMYKELQQSRSGTGQLCSGCSAVAIIEGLPADDNVHTSVTFRIPHDNNGDGAVLDSSGYVVEWSDKITYSLNNEQIIRSTNTGSTKVLANKINSLQFIRNSGAPRLITIIITARKIIEGTSEPVEYTLRSMVQLRN